MNSICRGNCAYDLDCRGSDLSLRRLDAHIKKSSSKLRKIPRGPNGTMQMGFYPGGYQNSAFRDFHNSRMMMKRRPRVEYWKYTAQRYVSRSAIR